MDSKQLAQSIKKLRQKAGLTQDGLSDKAGLSYSTLAKIEQGRIKDPSLFTIISIADALDVSIDELIGSRRANKPQKLSKQQQPINDYKQLKNGIEFIYFDVGGVLLHLKIVIEKIAKHIKGDPKKLETIFWKYNDPVCRGNMSVAELESAIEVEMGLGPERKVDYLDLYSKYASPIEETHNLLIEICSDIRVGIITNIYPGQFPIMMNKKLIPDLRYHSVIQSFDVDAVKPERKMFSLAERAASVPASSILLIDDTKANIAAAKQLGWRATWFDESDPRSSIEKIKSEHLAELFS